MSIKDQNALKGNAISREELDTLKQTVAKLRQELDRQQLDFSSKEQELKQLVVQARNHTTQEQKQRCKVQQALHEKEAEFDQQEQKWQHEQSELKSELNEC